MSHRFLFLNPAGREVGASSLEELADHLRAGRLTEGAPLYDGETGEWAPVVVHPVYPRIAQLARVVQESGHGGEAAAAPSKPAAPPPSAVSPPSPIPPLTSADELPELTLADPEDTGETVEEFLQARAVERAEDAMRFEGAERQISLRDQSYASHGKNPTNFASSSSSASGRREQPPTPAPLPGGAHPSGRTAPAAGATGGDAGPGPGERSARKDRRQPPWRKRRRRSGAPSPARQGVLFLLLVVVGAWGISDSWGVPLDASNDFSERPVVLPPPGPPPLAAEARDAQSAAFQDMVEGMDRLRARIGLAEPPAAWMSGEYLGDAAAYPQVQGYWERYAAFVDSLELAEEELFRSGFVSRLESQGVRGPILAIRLTRALDEFRLDRPRRETRYQAMRQLADEALGLHTYLVERTEAIEHTPAELGIADDPVLEVSFATDEEGVALWGRIDLLTGALEQVVGPDPLQMRNVAERVLESLAIE